MSESQSPKDGYPRLVVQNADAAIAFVQDALGGVLVERFAGPDGIVVHSKLMLGEISISLVEEVRDWGWLSPVALGGSPVLIQLDFENCDAVAERMIEHKAEAIIPIKDRPYGKREGRFRDPFGHLWILSQDLAA